MSYPTPPDRYRMRLRWLAPLAFLPLAGCGVIYKVDTQQGNLFDKQGFHTGTADQFRAFLERKTGQTMKKL